MVNQPPGKPPMLLRLRLTQNPDTKGIEWVFNGQKKVKDGMIVEPVVEQGGKAAICPSL